MSTFPRFLQVSTPARLNEAQGVAAAILDASGPVVPRKVRDITGERFGRLVVVSFAYTKTTGCKGSYWRCRCDCGGSVVVSAGHLRSGSTVSCGCRRVEIGKANALDLTGRVFGHLTVVRRAGSAGDPVVAVWLCRCAYPTATGPCGRLWKVRSKNLIQRQTRCGGTHTKATQETTRP